MPLSIEQWMEKLVKQDLMNVPEETAAALVDRANKLGYEARSFIDRKTHYVALRREDPRTLSRPIRNGMAEDN